MAFAVAMNASPTLKETMKRMAPLTAALVMVGTKPTIARAQTGGSVQATNAGVIVLHAARLF